MSTEQFLLVGLDVVRRFADNPPNLSAFLDDGAVGHLQAVLPGPHSSAAWSRSAPAPTPGDTVSVTGDERTATISAPSPGTTSRAAVLVNPLRRWQDGGRVQHPADEATGTARRCAGDVVDLGQQSVRVPDRVSDRTRAHRLPATGGLLLSRRPGRESPRHYRETSRGYRTVL